MEAAQSWTNICLTNLNVTYPSTNRAGDLLTSVIERILV